MSPEIELCNEIETKPNLECNCKIFESKDEMRRSLSRLCYGDLYVIGRLWIESMKTVLVGSKMCLLPVVKAAQPPPPQKPPKMTCTELPLHQSPHNEYYEYQQDKLKCKDYNVKTLHRFLLPYVTNYRRQAQMQNRDTNKMVQDTYNDACKFLCKTRKDIECCARDPDKLCERRIAVILGATVGLMIGYRYGKGVSKPLFFSGLGALAVGALCFPKKTDETVRFICYNTGKLGVAIFNMWCNKNFVPRERIPCERDIPPPPKKRKEQCPQKK